MFQPKNHVLVHPETNEYLIGFNDKVMRTTVDLSEAWISNCDTLMSVQGYINSVHEKKYKLIELTTR